MQFHLNGFRTGDPELLERAPAAVEHAGGDSLPSQCDVLIIGCGPAGLTLAAQLAAFADIRTCIVDQKSGPMASPAGRWKCSMRSGSPSAC
jgi:alkyl hydroperoxide reductase subunit AhpF